MFSLLKLMICII